MKIIGIIGTRRRDNSQVYEKIRDTFFEIYDEGDWICSGGCNKGGDRFAEMIAKEEGIPILIFYPNYKKFKRGAPFVRNSEVAKNSTFLIACVMKPEDGLDSVLERDKGGTEDTLKKYMKHKDKNGFIPKVYLV
jgi:hypothetical protein